MSTVIQIPRARNLEPKLQPQNGRRTLGKNQCVFHNENRHWMKHYPKLSNKMIWLEKQSKHQMAGVNDVFAEGQGCLRASMTLSVLIMISFTGILGKTDNGE